MKTAFVIALAAVCALALATPVKEQHYKVADKGFLEKQKDVLALYNYINQPSYYKKVDEYANTFKFEGHWDLWTKPEYAKEFYYYYKYDILPQGEVFSVFYPDHLKPAIALFKTLYYAKDWDTFYRIASWARQHVNHGLFVYSFTVAVAHSEWTEEIILPPVYEIFPNYFFSDEVIYKAQQYKQHYWGTYDKYEQIHDKSYNGYTIQANYTGSYVNVHPEQSLSYFTEDVGLNSYYFYHNVFVPFWLTAEEMGWESSTYSYRGQYFYYFHQQLLARYYLERLSNGLGEIPHFEYEYPIETGYHPSLTYTNGLKFPSRPSHANLYYQSVHGEQSYPVYGNYTWSYTYVKDYERRLRDALDQGWVYTSDGKIVRIFEKDGFNYLANLVESNADSVNERFYGDLLIFARHLLGFSYHPLDEYKVVPSALEHLSTSLRDPMFYQLYKRILYYFFQYYQYQGPYSKEELWFPGVKVEDVAVDRLITYFDYFYSDLSNAVYVNEKEFVEESFEIRARQYRLNHKSFNYKISVSSDRPVEAFVKIYIGPKYDDFGREIDLADNLYNFYELDRFKYTLQSGKNVIERSSQDSRFFAYDYTSYKDLYQQVMTAYNGGSEFKLYEAKQYYGFPQRLVLPKGSYGGQIYQLYVFVAPYKASGTEYYYKKYIVDDYYPLSYPLDRPIELEYDFFVPNSYLKDVVIYHRNVEEDINTSWSNY